jgi:hypothetical protein
MICRQEKGNAKFRCFRNLICRYFAQTSLYGSFHETKERFIYTGQKTAPRFLSSTRAVCTFIHQCAYVLYTSNIYCSSAYTILVECPEIYEWVWPLGDL